MLLAGPSQHLGREVYTDAAPRPQGGQQRSVRTADLEHTLAGAHEEGVDLLEPPMVGAGPSVPRIPLASHAVPMSNSGCAVVLSRRVEQRSLRHDGELYRVRRGLERSVL